MRFSLLSLISVGSKPAFYDENLELQPFSVMIVFHLLQNKQKLAASGTLARSIKMFAFGHLGGSLIIFFALTLQVELDSAPGGFELEKDSGNILTVAHGTNVSFFNANK